MENALQREFVARALSGADTRRFQGIPADSGTRMTLVPKPDHETNDETRPPNALDVLRAFVAAHSRLDPRTGLREPIWYLTFRGDLMHHALGANPPAVDDALIEEMQAHGLISIDYRENNWALTPTPYGRNVSLMPSVSLGPFARARGLSP
jgi:hypothetical protein